MPTAPVLHITRRLEEESEFLDEAREKVPFHRLFAERPELRDLLQGRSAGHAIHPVLVQIPLGTLVGALLLDVLAEPSAANKLLLVSLLTSAPSALTGWAEWVDADPASQRVGLVHAGANGLGVVLLAWSGVARLQKKRVRGSVLAGLAGVAWTVGGYLGGHISLVRKYASHAEGDRLGADYGSYRA
jgi:uncharacterized membrane protein